MYYSRLKDKCIERKDADIKVEAFREWYETRNDQERAQIDYLRAEVARLKVPNLGDIGIDELVASLILKADRRVGLV